MKESLQRKQSGVDESADRATKTDDTAYLFSAADTKEVSHELGITVPAVSKCISQAMQKMRNNSDDSARALEKGDWKYAW